jgi:hypothetical protein
MIKFKHIRIKNCARIVFWLKLKQNEKFSLPFLFDRFQSIKNDLPQLPVCFFHGSEGMGAEWTSSKGSAFPCPKE